MIYEMSRPTSANDLLYHYTSESGLQGIIGSDRIWATHIRFLNDYTEFRQAFKDRYVEGLTGAFRAGMRKDIDNIATLVFEGVLAKRNHAGILKIIEDSAVGIEAFVCSFTSSLQDGFDPGDRLSQWRGYSNSSQGFSLGFEKGALQKQVEIDNRGAKASVLECIYEDTGAELSFFQEMGHNASVRFNDLCLSGEAVPDSFRTNNPAATEEYKKVGFYFLKALSKATAQFFTKAARIKHSGFREEREWRIVLQASHQALVRSGLTKSRKGPFGETPYIEIPLGLAKPDSSPLRRIVVGPSSDKDDIKCWVQRLLERNGVHIRRGDSLNIEDGVEVSTSSIPFRSA
jgi:hypothetical protein